MNQAKFLMLAAFRRYLMMFGMSLFPLSIMRVYVLRLCGVRVGTGCYVGFNVFCDTNFPELIHIGNDVTLSHNCILMAHTGTPCNSPLGKLYQVRAKVEIGDGAWIGASSMLLPGVSVASHCMVGAGSVVTKSTDQHSLWAGNPCRRLKSLATDKSS